MDITEQQITRIISNRDTLEDDYSNLYYKKYLDKYKTGEFFISWNWCAAIFSSLWACYRLMPVLSVVFSSAIIFFGYILSQSALSIFASILSFMPLEELSGDILPATSGIWYFNVFENVFYFAFHSLSWGILGNWIYGIHIRSNTNKKFFHGVSFYKLILFGVLSFIVSVILTILIMIVLYFILLIISTSLIITHQVSSNPYFIDTVNIVITLLLLISVISLLKKANKAHSRVKSHNSSVISKYVIFPSILLASSVFAISIIFNYKVPPVKYEELALNDYGKERLLKLYKYNILLSIHKPEIIVSKYSYPYVAKAWNDIKQMAKSDEKLDFAKKIKQNVFRASKIGPSVLNESILLWLNVLLENEITAIQINSDFQKKVKLSKYKTPSQLHVLISNDISSAVRK